MRRFFERKLLVFIIVATIVALIVIGIFGAANRRTSVAENVGGTVTVPVQSAATGIGGWFKGLFGHFGDVKALKEATETLRNENTALQKQINDMQGLKNENEDLKRMLGLKEKSVNISMVAASVGAMDPSNWYSSFTINIGKNEGVERNQPVVDSNRYLVGQVSEVGENWAKVITILDPQSSIGGYIRRSKEIGIVEGNSELRYNKMCRLSYIARDTDIQKGDFIETSGLGGVFPRGLIIGTVSDIYDDNTTMSRIANIKPLADIAKVSNVFVVTDYTDNDLTIKDSSSNTDESTDDSDDSSDSDNDEDEE